MKRNDYCPTSGESCQSMCETQCGTKDRALDEMASLVRKLVQALRKAAPSNDLSEQALDYLKRKGLEGRILR